MTLKPKAKILPVRYNPGKNSLFEWDAGLLIWDKEEVRGKKRGPKAKVNG